MRKLGILAIVIVAVVVTAYLYVRLDQASTAAQTAQVELAA